MNANLLLRNKKRTDFKTGALLFTLLAFLLVMAGCGMPGDPIVDNLYTQNVYPGTTNTYNIGSADDTYNEGWFNDLYVENDASIGDDLEVTGNTVLASTVTINGTTTFNESVVLDGEGEVWLEFCVSLDWSSVQAHGVPTHVTRGVFNGYSLPVWGGGNEELLFEICIPERWKGPAWEKLGDTGVNPGGMAVVDDILYIPMSGDNTVWFYDGTTLGPAGDVGDSPRYAVNHNGLLYVSCRGDDEVWVFNEGTWSLSGAVGDRPMGMVSDGTDLYVACEGDDEVWRLSGGVWAVDPALGAGGIAGAVGDAPRFMASYGGDIYVGCGGVDDDVWIRTGGAWAKDDDVDDEPTEFQEHDGDLYLNCENDDTIWRKSGGAWAICTNIHGTLGNAPIGLTVYEDSLFSACMGSIWSDHHTVDAYVVPFWNNNSDFSKVTADEPMFLTEYDGRLYCACSVGNSIWVYEGETVKLATHCWITLAQAAATDAFRVEFAYNYFTPDVDTVPLTSDDIRREIVTGVAAQFYSYGLHTPLDLTGAEGDDSLSFRLRRVASSDEIAGEVVIQHVGVIFKCDKIGSPEP